MQAFVSRHVRKVVARNVTQYPFIETYAQSACVIANISGYSALACFLQQCYGPDSGTRIQALLNPHFAAMVDAVNRHSGNTVKFCGNNLIAVWSGTQGGGGSDCNNDPNNNCCIDPYVDPNALVDAAYPTLFVGHLD
ncbi:hypothetical protein HDU86_001139 [Geranomyces michiganensis]|nr:hypothetical protein HDU86_001139 [Geranomyces michiganensis]